MQIIKKNGKPTLKYSRTMSTDGLQNLVAGLGTEGDKLTNSQFVPDNFYNYSELASIYEGWLGRRMVDLPVNEALKKGWKVNCPSWEPGKIEKLEKYTHVFLDFPNKVNFALKMSRVFGGSIMLAMVDSRWGAFANPIPNFLPGKSLIGLQVFDAWQAYAAVVNFMNPLAKNFLYPDTYTIGQAGLAAIKIPGKDTNEAQAFGGAIVHHSRVLRFDGLDLPWYERQRNLYWGQSFLANTYSAVRNANLVDSSIATLLFRISVPVFKVPDLAQIVSDPQAMAAFMQRMNLLNYGMSSNHMALIDGDETMEEFSPSAISGLDSILERFYILCSAASGIPVVKLVGESAKGLNATGNGDLNNYYDMLEDFQTTTIKPKLMAAYKQWIVPSLFNELLPEDFDIDFPAIERVSATEKMNADKGFLDLCTAAKDAGIIDSKIMKKEILERAAFNNFTEEDIERMETAAGENEVGLKEALDVADGEWNEDHIKPKPKFKGKLIRVKNKGLKK